MGEIMKYLLITTAFLGSIAGTATAETRLKIMSYNICGGGANEDKGIQEPVAAIRPVPGSRRCEKKRASSMKVQQPPPLPRCIPPRMSRRRARP